MDQRLVTIVAIVAVLVVVGIVLGWLYTRKRRTTLLRQQFGPEYDRMLKKEGDPRRAESVLEWRAKRRDELKIVPLSPAQQVEVTRQWREVQTKFVDDPKGAVTEADELVTRVMHARGYPTTNFDQQADIISVDHPVVSQNYRAAHDIALRHSRGQASTEDLRKAMVHYRSLFEELLNDSLAERKEAHG